MTFKEAFEAMKKGAKVKLPSWGGYWYWDDDKKTIIMHTRDGEKLDIRQTDRPEYTFSFGDAIKYLKRGLKVSRKGWNGKRMYLFLADGEDLTSCLSEGDFKCASSVCMKTAQNNICVGWLASQADMLSEDWTFFE